LTIPVTAGARAKDRTRADSIKNSVLGRQVQKGEQKRLDSGL
jgi:hypothetical protein